MENGDEETAVSLTSGETSIVHLLLKDLLAICKKLEEIGEDALILYTGAQHVLGTSIGAMFVEPSSKILTKFQQFCKDRKNNPADRQIASDNTGTKEPVLNSLTVEEFINTHKPDHFSIFDEFNNDIDDDDDDDVEHSIVIENIMSIKEMPIIKAENTVDDLDGKLDKNSKQPLVSDAIKQVHKHSLRKVTENVQLIDKSLEKKLAVKIEQNDEVHSIENPATVLEESDGLNFSENPTRVFLDSLEIVSAEEAKLHSKSRTCSCYKCDKVLRSIGRLREHLTKVHKIKVGHKCVCGKFFSDEISFEAHKKSQKYRQMHHNCKQCNEVLTSEMALLMHVKQTHEKISILELDDFGEYPCEKCGSVFKHKYHLLSHNKKLLNCDKDMDETNNSTEKSVHNEIIQYEDPFDGNMISKTYKELIVAQKKAPWRCIICNSSYKRKSNFTRHMLTHMKADASRHICDICGKRFTSKECLTRHEKQHDSKPYSCTMSNLCKQKFGTELELTQHIKNQCKSGDRENCRCVICGQQLQSISALVIHQNMHSGYKPYKCDICGKCVTSSGSLERHKISVHQEETHFQCDTCQKRFKTKDNFKKHMKTHEEPKYHCEVCGKSCTEMGNLKKHMMSHTKEKPFVCELCGKAYGRKSLLDNHRRLHTGEKPFKCTIEDCEKCFRSYSNLQQHIRSHSDSNPFVCDVCGKSFKQPGRLHYHRKDHFIEFRWPCAYCTSKFKSVFMYKNHLAKSHPEKRKEVEEKWNIRLYQCDLCSKTYGDKEDYTRHVYIHQGIKPFKCQYCHKAFNDKSNLKQHEKIHTGDRRFQCEICHKAFIHNKTRRLHMKSCEGKSKQAAKISELNAKAEHMKDMINPERAGVDLFSQERKVKGEPVNMTRRGMESTRNQYINESGYQSLDTNGVTDVGIDSQDPRSVIQPQHYILEPNEIPLQNIPIAAVNSLTGQIEPLLIIENY